MRKKNNSEFSYSIEQQIAMMKSFDEFINNYVKFSSLPFEMIVRLIFSIFMVFTFWIEFSHFGLSLIVEN